MADHSIPSLLRSTLAAGDLIYRAASSTWARLAVGSTDDILSIASGLPSWKTLATLLANTMSNTRGALLRRGSSAWEAFTGSQGGVLVRDANDATWLSAPTVQGHLTHAGGTATAAWKFFAFKAKSGDTTSATRSNTMTNDPDLIVALDVSKTYYFIAFVSFAIDGTASDLKFDFNYTGTAPSAYQERAFETNGTTISNKTKVTSIGTDTVVDYSSATDGNIIFYGVITTGASSGGNFSLRWAENTAGTDNTIYKGSFLLVLEAQ